MKESHDITINGQSLDSSKIVYIKPYVLLDMRKFRHQDIKSTVVLMCRPFRLTAERSAEHLALSLGFHYLPEDGVAVNPRFEATVEPFTALNDKDKYSWQHAQSRLTLRTRGFVHRQPLKTAPDELRAILASPPRRWETFSVQKRSNTFHNDRS
jgi:hypothetical protein